MSRWMHKWWVEFPFAAYGLIEAQETIERMDETMDHMLTHLERMESQQMVYGLYDSSMRAGDWIDTYIQANSLEEQDDPVFAASVFALRQLGCVIALKEGESLREWTFRSRASEVARLLTKLRQRFDYQQYSYQSKSLVGNVKFDVRPRVVPRRDNQLKTMFGSVTNPAYDWIVETLTDLLVDRDKHNSGETFRVSGFQNRSFQTIVQQYLEPKGKSAGVVVSAGTGSGKTLSFLMPALFQVLAEKFNEGRQGVKVLSLYPRTRLANNQLQEYVSLILKLNRILRASGKVLITVGMEGQYTPTKWLLEKAMSGELELKEWERKLDSGGRGYLVCPWMPCECGKGELIIRAANAPELACSSEACTFDYSFLCVTKDQLKASPPDILLGVTESISKRLMASDAQPLFGLGEAWTAPSLIMLDEIHLQSSISGMQTGYFLRRLLHRIHRYQSDRGIRPNVQVVGLSATIGEPTRFFHELTGIRPGDISLVAPMEDEMRIYGAEYYYFVQADRKGEASMLTVLIQTAMCLLHNLHPPASGEVRYKAFGFVNSRDIAYRWHGDMRDAEQGQQLFRLRAPGHIQGKGKRYLGLPPLECQECAKKPQVGCVYFQHGECWWPMHSGGRLNAPLEMRPVTSLGGGSLADLDLIISTSTLEVGYDDPLLMTVIQHQAPTDISGFVQRKGRGGRQAGTRPVMLTVLSPHASMDQFYFNNTHILTDPVFQKMPLNPQNYLVQRVHGFFAVMDFLAYKAAMDKCSFDTDRLNRGGIQYAMRTLGTGNQNQEMKRYVEDALGITPENLHRVLTEKDGVFTFGIPQLMARASAALQGERSVRASDLLNDYVPQNLFSDIQLPEVKIRQPGSRDDTNERIEVALAESTPGRVTYRWQNALWIVPNGQVSDLDANLLWMNPESFMAFLPAQKPVTIAVRKLPLSHQAILKGAFGAVGELEIRQPISIDFQPFAGRHSRSQSGMESGWEYDPKRQIVTESAGPDRAKRVDRRNSTQALSSYHLEWPDITPIRTTNVRGFLYGALSQLRIAENRPGSEYLQVQKVYAGYELGLRYGKDLVRDYSIAYRDAGDRPMALGYRLETEGVCFEFDEAAFAMDYSAELENALRWRYFRSLAGTKVATECRVPHRTIGNALTALSLSAALRQLNQASPSALLEKRDMDHWSSVVTDHLGVAAYIQEELLALRDHASLWERLNEAAEETRILPLATLIHDPLLLTLTQVLKKAAQLVTGVEIKGDLASHVELRMDYGDAAKPAITLFELGMKGTGVMRSLHYVLDNRPELFWNQAEHEAFHCDQGDEEAVVRAVLGLPEGDLEVIASYVQQLIQQSTIMGRNAIIERLTDHLRSRYGFILQPAMIRMLRSVCAPSPETELFDQNAVLAEVKNWRLYQELFRFVFETERTAGRELEAEVLVEMFMRQLLQAPTSFEQWSLMKTFIERAAVDTASMDTIKTNVDDEKKPLYRVVFSALTKAEAAEYAEMPEDECKELLRTKHEIRPEWVNLFYESAFAKENGYSPAYLYWAYTHNQVHDESVRAIELQTRYRLKESIRSRLLRTCLDGCPSCLHASTDVVPRWRLPDTVSRRLLEEFLEHLWRRDDMLVDLGEEPGLSERQVMQRIEQFYRRGTNRQMRIRHVPHQIETIHKAIGKLIARGVHGASGNIYALSIAGVHARDYNLQSGPVQELVLNLQEALDL